MNLFLNEKVEVKKDDVKDEDKEEVDGLESLVQRFTSHSSMQFPVEYAGTEGKGKQAFDYIIQLAKDVVDFILNLVNNRLARTDNRLHRAKLRRKINGLKSGEVPYPTGIRRMMTPLNVSTDANWVANSIAESGEWYNKTIKAYDYLNDYIGKIPEGEFDLERHVDTVIDTVAGYLDMKKTGDTYTSPVLPSNRHLVFEIVSSRPSDFKLFFLSSGTQVKLKSETFESTSFIMDNTATKITTVIKDIRSNQSTVSQLYRKFEKRVKVLEHARENVSASERSFYSWVIQFNRRLMSTNIQYVLGQVDVGIDFIKAGTKNGS